MIDPGSAAKGNVSLGGEAGGSPRSSLAMVAGDGGRGRARCTQVRRPELLGLPAGGADLGVVMVGTAAFAACSGTKKILIGRALGTAFWRTRSLKCLREGSLMRPSAGSPEVRRRGPGRRTRRFAAR